MDTSPLPHLDYLTMTLIPTLSSNSKTLKTSHTKLQNCARTLSKIVDHTGIPRSKHIHKRQNSDESDSDTSVASGSCLEITSGPARTHSTLLDTTATVYGPRITHEDIFLCKGAVDLRKLLYLSRRTLYVAGKENGANVLLDEQWRCKISHPKFRKQDRFRVKIRYSANIARSHWPDAQRPVEIEAARGIEGLMIILDRKE